MLVFEEINFTVFFARKHGIGKLTKMAWILINKKPMSKKPIFKKYRSKNVTNLETEIN